MPVDRRQRWRRLLICLPLLAVLWMWVASLDHPISTRLALGAAHYRAASIHGEVEIDRLADDPTDAVPVSATRVPWWGIWLATAGLTGVGFFSSRRAGRDAF